MNQSPTSICRQTLRGCRFLPHAGHHRGNAALALTLVLSALGIGASLYMAQPLLLLSPVVLLGGCLPLYFREAWRRAERSDHWVAHYAAQDARFAKRQQQVIDQAHKRHQSPTLKLIQGGRL